MTSWVYWTFIDTHSQASYPRVGYWIQAAECARTTGRYLLICDPKKGEIPVEDVSLADDRGHTLLLSFLSHAFNTAPSESLLRSINTSINWVGFLALSFTLLHIFGSRSAIFAAILGLYWIGARAGPDVDAAAIGVSALVASALLLAVSSQSLVSLICIAFAFVFASLIREPLGLGAGLSLIALAITLWIFRSQHSLSRNLRSAILILIALVALKAPSVPTAIRDWSLGTKATGTAAHGLSHNLFLGLGGFVENKWGIVWDDAYAQKVIHDLDPTIEYCSDAYFKAIGQLYWQYVSEDPLEALRIYAVKTLRTLSAAEGLSWSALISLIAISFLFWRARQHRRRLAGADALSVFSLLLFGFSFIGQGILTHPAWTYIAPGPILLMIAAAIVFDQTRVQSIEASRPQ